MTLVKLLEVDIRVHELARGIESEVHNGCTFRVLTGFDYLDNATVIAAIIVAIDFVVVRCDTFVLQK
jgi:hypothetical protein